MAPRGIAAILVAEYTAHQLCRGADRALYDSPSAAMNGTTQTREAAGAGVMQRPSSLRQCCPRMALASHSPGCR